VIFFNLFTVCSEVCPLSICLQRNKWKLSAANRLNRLAHLWLIATGS
jgi:hypothetical protein